MAIKLINASIMHIKPSHIYKNVWQQIDANNLKNILLDNEVDNFMGEDLTKAVRETLGVEIPESNDRGKFGKEDTLIPVLLDDDRLTFYKLSFRNVG